MNDSCENVTMLLYIPNCTGCLSDHAPGRVACATVMESERMLSLAMILYYSQLVFALNYREPMDKCWKSQEK